MTTKQSKALDTYLKQTKELHSQGVDCIRTKIPCGECDKKYPIYMMYRCYKCGIYICQFCGPMHFGLIQPKVFKNNIDKCPNCDELLVFPRGGSAYCEECGWPDIEDVCVKRKE